MPFYPKAINKNIPPPKEDPPITARVVILHVADSEGDSLYGYFNGNSGGVESHFYIRYDGTVEQYRDTNYQADANMQANNFGISIETEGLANGTWTDSQINAIKALILWLHDVEKIPLVVPKTWDGTGVGYHTLFEAQWDGRNASCPGPNRIKQFNNVLVPWMAAGGKDSGLSSTDAQDVKDYVAALLLKGYTMGGVAQPAILDVLVETQKRASVARDSAGDAARDSAAALALAKVIAAKVDIDPTELAQIEASAKAGAEAAIDERIKSANVSLNVTPPAA